MRLVILESPFNGPTDSDIETNIRYARACVRDCVLREESASASHLLFTQEGILRDKVPAERALGIRAGLAWRRVADASVVYTDRGLSTGMKEGIRAALADGKPVEVRMLTLEQLAALGIEIDAVEQAKRHQEVADHVSALCAELQIDFGTIFGSMFKGIIGPRHVVTNDPPPEEVLLP